MSRLPQWSPFCTAVLLASSSWEEFSFYSLVSKKALRCRRFILLFHGNLIALVITDKGGCGVRIMSYVISERVLVVRFWV